MESRLLLATIPTFTVFNANDSGPGSLDQAIRDSNGTPNVAPSIPNQIVFAIPGTGPFTIPLTHALPTIMTPVSIDGYSQSGSSINKTLTGVDETETDVATLMIHLDGSSPGAGIDGLDIATVGCTVDGLIVTGFKGAGINLLLGPSNLTSAIGNDIWGNFIGVSSFDTHSSSLVTPGANPQANGIGIAVSSPNNRIGGSLPDSRNVIQGNNGPGVSLTGTAGTGNLIEGSYVLDNNSDGILITTSNNSIGEVIGQGPAGAGNIISGNEINGVHIQGSAAHGNVVVNNEIGTDVGQAGLSPPIRGMDPRPNLKDGVLIDDAPGNTVGGLLGSSFNVIAANGYDGVAIQNNLTQGATGNQVEGNKIGYNLRGSIISRMPNRDGINISSSGNTVGGTSPAARNVIIDNLRNGITISSDLLNGGNVETGTIPMANPTANVVLGNYIGTQGGADNYANALEGIFIDDASGNTVGGTAGGAQNVISANKDGVVIHNPLSTGNLVQGNLIGTMSDGVTVLGNAIDGVRIDNASKNTIGGTAAGAGNVISGNNWGVRLTGPGTTGNVVQSNAIGTDLKGVDSIRNAVDGVLITLGASNNMIGGQAAGTGNTIAFNVGNGVNVLSGTGNSIVSNLIYGNNLLGIDLGGDGVTLNHAGPTAGPNNYQNFPVLSSVIAGMLSTNVRGNLQSSPGTSFLIQFFSNSTAGSFGYGQGQTLIGSTTVTTDGSGNAVILTAIAKVIPIGTIVSSTATNLSTGDTSEFSFNVTSSLTQVPFLVTNTNDSGPGSLRQAIIDANNTPNIAPSIPDLISFALPGVGPFPIHVTTPLPMITDAVDINGYSQPGSSVNKTVAGLDELETDVAVLMVQIEGSSAGANANGLTIATVGCQISGLIITGFSGAGIALVPGSSSSTSAIGNSIEGNFIGVSSVDTHSSSLVPRGGNPLANGVGIAISSSNNRIGGSLPPSRNVIQGNNGVGISVSGTAGTGNLIEGDYVLDNNSDGILITTSNNYVGEAIGLGPAGAGSVISGNINGIHIVGSAAKGNIIVNNEIGTNIGIAGSITPTRGLSPRANVIDGILIEDAPGNTIGGLIPGTYNVIAANGTFGIGIQNTQTLGATGNIVEGNKIGYNIRSGLIKRMPNLDGINVSSANNTIGGSSLAAQNIIIDNLRNGITITSMQLDPGDVETGPIANADPSGNLVEGNFIGTQGGGDNFGNALIGVMVDAAPDNTVGGTSSGAANVISANNEGVVIRNPASVGNLVQGNLIGTMADGMTPLGNAVNGVSVENAPGNTIGGTASGAGNVISGNNTGVLLTGSGTTGTLVQGNAIGTDRSASVPVRNAIDGVLITSSASNNAIGGTDPGAGNSIAYNVGNGVNVLSGTGNSILSNRIFGNNLLGIDLGGDGVTPNHPNGGVGPNDLQSYPVLTAVSASIASTSVQGTLQSLPNTSFLIQLFSNTTTTTSGYGQGDTPIGSVVVTTDGNGNAAIATTATAVVPQGVLVTATATNLTNNDTSEFSQAISSTPVSLQFAAGSYSVSQSAGSITIDVKRSGNQGGLVTVAYATGGGTAQAGVDYSSSTGTLTFNPGQTDRTFVIPIIDTNMVGPDTTVNLTLSSPTGGSTLGSQNPVTLTIQNGNQLTTQLGAAAFSVSETAGKAIITVTRNSGSASSTIAYATGGGTAVPGVNYTPTSGTLLFNAGQTTLSFAIPVTHDFQVTGPLTVGITLSNPGSGVLGSPSSAVLTINDVDQPGALQFATGAMTVGAGAATTTVTVQRVGGVGGTVSVAYSSGGGTAVPGTDYTPVSGVLTFAPGQSTQTIAIPIPNSSSASNTTFMLTLGSPGGGASLGNPATLNVTIAPLGSQPSGGGGGASPNVLTPNAVGPVITDLQLTSNGQAITSIVLSFSGPLDPTRAVDLRNYGNVLRTTGPDGVFGTYDDGLVALASAAYDPAARTVTLTPAAPLPLNAFYQIAINQNANALTGAGVADPTGALLNAGVTGGPYVAEFALGTRLAYTDGGGNSVGLSLSGGGLVELRLGANSIAQQLRILNAVPRRSVLNGQVHRAAPGASGRTPLLSILGAAGVKLHLKSFIVGSVSLAPSSQSVPTRTSLGHRITHVFHGRRHH